MGSWLEKYRRGDRRQVWDEITALGSSVRNDPAMFTAAEQVGRETMRRARSNVELLLVELPSIGYVFESGEGLVTFEPPSSDASDQIDEIEARVGPIPLSWRWWSEEVGRLNLMGRHPGWHCDHLDPLVVDAPTDYIHGEIDVWEQDKGGVYDTGRPFSIDFSPDYLHKANISGGAPYSLAIPNEAADGLVLWEVHNTTFVNYLRTAFTHAGFLGWSSGHCAEHVPGELVELAKKLEPL